MFVLMKTQRRKYYIYVLCAKINNVVYKKNSGI